MNRSSQLIAALIASWSLFVLGCGTPRPSAATETGTSTSTSTGGGPPTCGAGEVAGLPGSCLQVGIQGCASLFQGDDGLCHPRVSTCKPGTIPKLDEGCVPVGVPMCAKDFIGDDGLCRPNMSQCPAGTFAVPQLGCTAIDGPSGCGVGPWGDIPDAAGNVYVDPSAPPGGVGSKASPFATLAQALGTVVAGGRIALAAGSYAEPLLIEKGIEIAGRCASMVTISGTAPAGGAGPAIARVANASGASLHGVTLAGPGIGLVASSAKVEVYDVVIQGATSIGVLAENKATQLSLRRVLIRGTLPEPVGKSGGGGINAVLGATVTLEDCALSSNRGFGILVQGKESKLSATDVLIEATLPDLATGAFGFGIDAPAGRVTLAASVVTGNHTIGVLVEGKGTLLDVTDSVIASTSVQVADGVGGRGLAVQLGAAGTIDRTAIVDNAGAGVFVAGIGAHLEAKGILVRASKSEGGVAFEEGATGQLLGSAITGNKGIGLSLLGAGVVVTADHDTIEETKQLGNYGRGVEVGDGAHLTLTSSSVAGNHEAGILVEQKGSVLTATACLVEGNLPRAGHTDGFGIAVQLGAQATFEGSAFLANHQTSVMVLGDSSAAGDGTHATLRGTLIQGTIPAEQTDLVGYYGVGVLVLMSGGLTLDASVVRDHHGAGVLVAGASAEVSGSLIEDVVAGLLRPNEQLAIDDAGDCLLVHDAKVTVTGTTVQRCSRAGFLFDTTAGSLSASTATANRFGLVLQGMPRPTAKDNVLKDNTEKDDVADGDLAVPNAPAPLPP